jgi:hypothetical protein
MTPTASIAAVIEVTRVARKMRFMAAPVGCRIDDPERA